MKYIKLVRVHELKSEVLAEIQDVPLNKIITASLNGTLQSDNSLKDADSFTVRVQGPASSNMVTVRSGVIYKIYVPGLICQDGTCDWLYIYDAGAKKRVLVSDLGAASLPELIFKLTMRGLVYSTDDVLMDIPEAVKEVARLKDEIAEKDARLASLKESLDDARAKLAEAENRQFDSGKPARRASKWKRMLEGIFSSEGDESWES